MKKYTLVINDIDKNQIVIKPIPMGEIIHPTPLENSLLE